MEDDGTCDPRGRDRKAVADDLANGLISAETAGEIYGLSIKETPA